LITTCRNDNELEEKLLDLSIADSEVCVTIADPNLPDTPLICCSDGFEVLTGYPRSEVIGRNCRFLNQSTGLSPSVRKRLQRAVMFSLEFVDILPNVKKSGEPFRNLLYMTSLVLRGRKYIMGVQADVTDTGIYTIESWHVEQLRRIGECIFSASLDDWVLQHSRNHAMRLYTPISSNEGLQTPVNQFIVDGHDCVVKNTFIEYAEDDDFSEKEGRKRSKSNPNLHQHSLEEPYLLNVSPQGKSAVAGQLIDAEDGISCAETMPSTPGDLQCSSIDESDWRSAPDSPNSGLQGLKSIGSAAHPHGCTECSFYFFGQNGCIKGADCLFCHEFHPRTKSKRGRRLGRAKRAEMSQKFQESGSTSETLSPQCRQQDANFKRGQEAPRAPTSASVIRTMSYESQLADRRDVGRVKLQPCSGHRLVVQREGVSTCAFRTRRRQGLIFGDKLEFLHHSDFASRALHGR